MATLMTIRPRFYNNDGTVAAGGKLYTYAAGTTTPVTTYTTAAASVANTNPIILDSKGEADIWVTGVLKVNLLQSNDVQVTGFPIDNINFPSVTMWNDRGNFDASVNTYPTTGGSGVGNAIVTGDVWTISVVATSGPLNGQLVGTTVRALVDTPGQTGANWSILDVGLGASNAAAVAAAAAAAVSETNAATSASNASTSATNASNSASSASSSAASALAYAQAMSLNATTDTSASSNDITVGAKTFTVTAGKSFVPGMFLVIADTAAPSTNSMYGQITSYSGTTLVVNVLSVLGSGTKTAWTISQTSAANLNVDTATLATSANTLNSGMVTIASHATTADIFAAAGNTIDWTGTATTTAFPNAPKAGMTRTLYCAGACAFTAGANLLIEGHVSGETVTLAAGAKVDVIAITTTQFKLFYVLSGSFTITANGYTSNPTGTAKYILQNGVVTLHIPYMTGTSNSIEHYLSGIPSVIVPAGLNTNIYLPAVGIDNNTNVTMDVIPYASANFILAKNHSSSSWTSSGTKAVLKSTISYNMTY